MLPITALYAGYDSFHVRFCQATFATFSCFSYDAFAFMLDLVTEVVVAAFLFLVNGSDVEFDFAFLSHLTHSLW